MISLLSLSATRDRNLRNGMDILLRLIPDQQALCCHGDLDFRCCVRPGRAQQARWQPKARMLGMQFSTEADDPGEIPSGGPLACISWFAAGGRSRRGLRAGVTAQATPAERPDPLKFPLHEQLFQYR